MAAGCPELKGWEPAFQADDLKRGGGWVVSTVDADVLESMFRQRKAVVAM